MVGPKMFFGKVNCTQFPNTKLRLIIITVVGFFGSSGYRSSNRVVTRAVKIMLADEIKKKKEKKRGESLLGA